MIWPQVCKVQVLEKNFELGARTGYGRCVDSLSTCSKERS